MYTRKYNKKKKNILESKVGFYPSEESCHVSQLLLKFKLIRPKHFLKENLNHVPSQLHIPELIWD